MKVGFIGLGIMHGERVVKRTFEPGFRIKPHQKDLNLALSNARQLGIALPNTATAQEPFNSCAAHGGDRAADQRSSVPCQRPFLTASTTKRLRTS